MRAILRFIKFLPVIVICNSCLHYEAGLGEYSYKTPKGNVTGSTQVQKVGIGNVMAKGGIGFNGGALSRSYSSLAQENSPEGATFQTTGSYLGLSLGIPFGKDDNHSIFTEYEYQSENFDLDLFADKKDLSESSRTSDSIGFRTVKSHQFSLGYRFSNFWKKEKKRSTRSSDFGGLHFNGNLGNLDGDAALVVVGVLVIFIIAEVIAEQIAESADMGRYHSFSWHMKYNYRRALFTGGVLQGMDPNMNEMHEQSVTAGLVIDWI